MSLPSRTTVLRTRAQGYGLVRNEALSAEELEVFGCKSSEEFYVLIVKACDLLSPLEPSTGAIRNALGIDYAVRPKNLTARRSFYANSTNISMRTLMRYEETGASALAHIVDMVRHHVIDTGVLSTAERLELDYLRGRVHALEELVARLTPLDASQS